MKVTVFGKDLQKKVIFEQFVSLLWTVGYSLIGSFCLELNATDDVIGLIEAGDYVETDEHPMSLMVATSVEMKQGKIIVRGQTADFLLMTRVSDSVIKNKNAEDAMRGLVSAMAPIPHLTLGESAGLTDVFNAQVSDKSVYDYCVKIAEATDVGFRIRRSKKELVFECYKPPLNAGVMFSAKFGNLSNERYAESVVNFANVAVVAGQGSGENRVTVTAGDTESTGLDRVEIYVDARNLQQDAEETLDEYIERLKAHGEEKLAGRTKLQNTEFTVSDETVSLGDLVQIKPTYSTVRLMARVTSITIKCQNNQITKTAAVGTPIVAGKRG